MAKKKRKYIESYLEYFKWGLNYKSPSVMVGLKEKDERNDKDNTKS